MAVAHVETFDLVPAAVDEDAAVGQDAVQIQ
jgi:hypothetical protein